MSSIEDRLNKVMKELSNLSSSADEVVSAQRMTKQAQREMAKKAKRRGEKMGKKIWIEVTSQPTRHKGGTYIGRASFHWQKDSEKKKHSMNIKTGGPARIQVKSRKLWVKPKDGEGYFYGEKAQSGAQSGAQDKEAGKRAEKLAPPMQDGDKDGIDDAARVGVPADMVPSPPGIPRLPNLSKEEKEIESRFIDAFEKDPDGVADQYLRMIGNGNKFVTDDAKMLSPDYTPEGSDPGAQLFRSISKRVADGEKHDEVVASLSDEEKALYEDTRRQVGDQRAKYNIAFHQVANAIAKRAFVKKLDELAKLPEGDARRSVLVTSGGCGAGKGFAIKNVDVAKDVGSKVGAIWDAAGEQNSTENPWILEECKKRGLKANFLFVDADPKVTWADPQRGVSQRAANFPPQGEGRMVDARLFADSYALGAKNFEKFHEQNKDSEDANFMFINSRGSKIELADGLSEEAKATNTDELTAWALEEIETKAPTEAIKQGAKVGNRIWEDAPKKTAASVMAWADGRGLLKASKLQDEYKAFFEAKMKKYGVDSPDDMDVVTRKKFFNEIEREWKEGVGPVRAAAEGLEEMQKLLIENMEANLSDLDGFYAAKWEDQLKMLQHALVKGEDGSLSLPAKEEEPKEEEAPAEEPKEEKSEAEEVLEESLDKPAKAEKEEEVQARLDTVADRLFTMNVPLSVKASVEEAAYLLSASFKGLKKALANRNDADDAFFKAKELSRKSDEASKKEAVKLFNRAKIDYMKASEAFHGMAARESDEGALQMAKHLSSMAAQCLDCYYSLQSDLLKK